MCLYLARADRVVVGADLTRASLRLGAGGRAALRRSSACSSSRPICSGPGLRAGAFDVVYSSGVLHHTPRPARVVRAPRRASRGPGGIIVLGVYNAFARMPSRLRRVVARLSGFRFIPFDPVLRDRDGTSRRAARRGCAISISIPKSTATRSARCSAGLPRTASSICGPIRAPSLGDEPDDLFTPAPDNWAVEGWLAQLGWMRTLGHEGGLFFTIGRVK